MHSSLRFTIVVLCFLIAYVKSEEGIIISSVRVESCRGCQLNRLPEVKQFIHVDVPLYENVEFKHIQGAPPELVLLNPENEEVQRLPLARLTRLECNELLESKGFFKKDEPEKDKLEL